MLRIYLQILFFFLILRLHRPAFKAIGVGTTLLILLLIICSTLRLPTLDVNISTEKLSSSNEPGNNVTNITSSTANSNQAQIATNEYAVNDPNLELQLVFRGLQNPSNMAFLGQDDILVLEKNDGTVRRIVNGTMLPEPVLDVEVANLVERGMLGIAIAGDQNYVFLYYTESGSDGSDAEHGAAPFGNRLYRYELVNGKLTNPKLLLDFDASRGASHNGGALTIGPDNNVYLIVGDMAGHKTLTQNYQNSTELSERQHYI